MRTISTTPIWRRFRPMRGRKRRSSKSCLPAMSKSYRKKTAGPLPRVPPWGSPLKSEMIEDQADELGRMGEGAHMACAWEYSELGVGQCRRQEIDDGAGRGARLAAGDEQRWRGDPGIVLQAGLGIDGDGEFERDLGDGGGDRRLEA